MASGGWFGYLPSSAKILLKRGQRNRNNGSSPVGERAETVQTSGGDGGSCTNSCRTCRI